MAYEDFSVIGNWTVGASDNTPPPEFVQDRDITPEQLAVGPSLQFFHGVCPPTFQITGNNRCTKQT
jgi:hypothetical protein